MIAHKHVTKCIVAAMAAAVLFCVLAMAFRVEIAEALGGGSMALQYETELFDTDKVIRIDIRMEEGEWEDMLANASAEEYYSCDVEINGQELYHVGIRPKGNTSLSAIVSDPDTDRFSLKLEFDHYVDGQNCFGLDKLILNNNYADATNMKEAIVYDMYRYLEADASLYNYAEISVNGEYWGVYLALEAVEESFLLRNYGAQDGELYKPESMGMGGDMGKGGPESWPEDQKGPEGEGLPFGGEGSPFGGGMPAQEGNGPDGWEGRAMPESMDTDQPDMAEGERADLPENGRTDQPGMWEEERTDLPENVDTDQPDMAEAERTDLPENVDTDRPGIPGGERADLPEGMDTDQPGIPGEEGRMPSRGGMGLPEGFDPSGKSFGGGFSMGGNGANLNYTDEELDSYSTIWEGEVTDTGKGDHRRVVAALKNIGEGTELERYLDTDNVLRYMAAHTFSVNLDSLSGNMAHNYYLYESGGKLNILPWDYNLAFGGMSMGAVSGASEMVNDAIDTPFQGTAFFDALLEDETYRSIYHEYLRQLVEGYVFGGEFQETYGRIRSQIDSLVESDPTAFYSYEEYDMGAGMLYRTVMLRAESIRGQLDGRIPSTDEAQRMDSSELVDASEIDVEAMGIFSMGGKSFHFNGIDVRFSEQGGEIAVDESGDTDAEASTRPGQRGMEGKPPENLGYGNRAMPIRSGITYGACLLAMALALGAARRYRRISDRRRSRKAR